MWHSRCPLYNVPGLTHADSSALHRLTEASQPFVPSKQESIRSQMLKVGDAGYSLEN